MFKASKSEKPPESLAISRIHDIKEINFEKNYILQEESFLKWARVGFISVSVAKFGTGHAKSEPAEENLFFFFPGLRQ